MTARTVAARSKIVNQGNINDLAISRIEHFMFSYRTWSIAEHPHS
jgi:hypothetical protein